ncbi:MAG: hypothetical protein ABIT01_00860 [Thermoanaerobaculia bacterium]
MTSAPTTPIDARVYIDESGEKGYVDVVNPSEFGLLLGVIVRDCDGNALRAALQPYFDSFVRALPPGMKPHITDAFASRDPAVCAVATSTRASYQQVARSSPITVVYEAISASGFARRRDERVAMATKAETARRSGIRITNHPHRDRLEEELLEGFLLKLDAFGEDHDLAHISVTSDTLSKGVRDSYADILEQARTASNRTEEVKGYNPATRERLKGALTTRIIVPVGSGLDVDVRRAGDITDRPPEPLLLLADILVNSLRHHFKTTVNPATDPLNAPGSIRGWTLEASVYGVMDEYAMDVV